jgi:predicted Zn finger-like uncharacterized protein
MPAQPVKAKSRLDRAWGGQMIITCPACETRYNVPDNTVGGRARKVRCAKCSHEWVIDLPSEEAAPEAEPKAAVEPSETSDAAPDAGAAPDEAAVRERPMRIRSDKRRPARDLRPRRAAADVVGTLVLSTILLGGIAFAVIAWRVAIVRAVPLTAAFYGAIGIPVNALGIEIHQKDWQIAQQNGLPVLTINGTITNTSGRGVAVPPLELTLRDEKQRELYHWKVVLNAKHLSPGETQSFQIVQKSPPLEAHDVEIRFAPGA